jgi:DNA-binding transcriptional regulator GbsR (MarR family)
VRSISPVTKKFVLHWGEMASRWGISRTVAQIYALLYLSETPLNAEELAAALSISRSNVSVNVRELEGWGLIRVVHVMGDRRDRYETLEDIGESFRIIIDERRRREVEPMLVILRDCMALASSSKESRFLHGRLSQMADFVQCADDAYHKTRHLPLKGIIKLLKAVPR